MRPAVDPAKRHRPDPPTLRFLRVLNAVLGVAVLVVAGYIVVQVFGTGSAQTTPPGAGEAPEAPVVPIPSTTTSSTPTITLSEVAPAPGQRLVIPVTEMAPEAKQLAVDIAYSLTTYDEGADHRERLEALDSHSGVDLLAEVSAPLIYDGRWSRGEAIYPQLGGLNVERASVMVVTRQSIGSGAEADFSVVRTLDIRLVRGESGWEFDHLASAGGTFDRTEDPDLAAAHAVATDPRITMPDSARLDIVSGLASSDLLDVMAELAEQTTYEVVTLATGHPYHVFDTDSISHHTVGQAVDINRIGDRLVIDDREPGSTTRAIVQWLYDHPEVHQVGSPWDIDGPESRRSFTDAVHQDHIHLAVVDR